MIRVVAGIIEHHGRLLICQRRRDATFGLQWEFPGGKIQPGETPQEALRRELHEELEVDTAVGDEIYRVRHEYKELPDEIELIFYAVTITQPTFETPGPPADSLPRLRNLVFERIEWVRRSDLGKYDFLPADRLLVERLVRGDLTTEFGSENTAG